MKFNIEEMKTRITCGNRTFFFKFPKSTYLLPQRLQPNNLSLHDRLSIHEDFYGASYDNTRNIIITFKATSETDEQLSTFVAECFALCKFGIR